MNLIFDWIFSQYKGTSTHLVIIELLGGSFGLISVFFSKRRNIWVYPTGIVSTVLYVYLLWEGRLFGDMLINAYYTAMSLYGWILWAKHREDSVHVKIGKMNLSETQSTLWLALFSWLFVMLVYYFRPYINHDFSMEGIELGFKYFVWTDWVDATTTAIFLVGMWLMARRKIENWLFWIVGNIISVPLYAYKGFLFSSLIYIVYTLIAVLAYIEWKKILYNSRASASVSPS